ncbi:MAG: winged helix-turn-helix domain-containing protein [Candidatus Bathyarchaeia archaeon]|jgi:DNA-binding transcriptional ArsR family regulator
MNKKEIMEEVDWSSLHKILSDTTRRSILELLAEKEAIGYTEIMALLQITNTGRLNYHLKALKGLVSKDDQGKYRLTEKGQLAVNLLRTFPERIQAEKKQHSALKIAVAVVLILAGILLISAGLFLLASFPATMTTVNSMHVSILNQTIPKNTTVLLTSWNVPSGASPLNIAWSASSPVYIYVMNSTQHDALLLQHATDGQVPSTLENFSGTPPSWLSQYDLQTGSVSLSLAQGQYYFLAGSNAPAILDLFSLTQSPQAAGGSLPSLLEYLPGLFFIALGAFTIAIAVLILTRRIWR